MKKSVQLWIERAEYDWETASVMMANGRYLYVAFMCQQAVEKLLKGYLQHQTDELPPYTHNLGVLAQNANLKFSEDQLDFLALLTRYYLNARYPDHKQKLSQELNQKKAQEILRRGQVILEWLKKELKI